VIAATVSCCAQVDRVMAGTSLFQAEEPGKFESIERYKFAVPTNYFVDALDAEIAGAFQRALSKISEAGAKIAEIAVPGMDIIGAINARGGISAPEAYAFHRRIGTQFERCDRFVSERILRGKEVSAADYLDMLGARRSVAIGFMEALAGYDAMLCPTVPIVAPEIARLEESPDEFRRVNRLLLRNPSVVNFLDGCALSLPCHRQGEAPVGLMLVGRPMEDEHLLAAGIAVERWLSYARD
jgi:aspartyl-tRNA(Asn)/glutamyl-tRNA(Gln) amidotransferase subunit A